MPDDRSSPTMSEQQIRTEMGAVLDQLQDLPPDAFRERPSFETVRPNSVACFEAIEVPSSPHCGGPDE